MVQTVVKSMYGWIQKLMNMIITRFETDDSWSERARCIETEVASRC